MTDCTAPHEAFVPCLECYWTPHAAIVQTFFVHLSPDMEPVCSLQGVAAARAACLFHLLRGSCGHLAEDRPEGLPEVGGRVDVPIPPVVSWLPVRAAIV